MTTASPRVLIADPNASAREALAAVLDALGGFAPPALASAPAEAVRLARRIVYDIAIVDPAGQHHDQALDELVVHCPTVLFLTFDDGLGCRRRAAALGATVIDKAAAPDQLVRWLDDLRRDARATGLAS